MMKQLSIAMIALSIGNLTGNWLKIQKGMNRLGQYAKEQLSEESVDSKQRFNEGFITCTILYCVGPMAFLGALQEGLDGNYTTLVIKGLLDGLSTMVFVTMFGWGVMLSALPVLAYQGSITLMAHYLAPILEREDLIHSINATGGLLLYFVALVVLNVKRIELGNYLPSLVYAPLIVLWWGW